LISLDICAIKKQKKMERSAFIKDPNLSLDASITSINNKPLVVSFKSLLSAIRISSILIVISCLLASGPVLAQLAPDLSARDARAQLGLSCVLVDKVGVPDDLMKAYWGDIHGPLGSRNMGVDGYWEHWLGKGIPDFFPNLNGVDQKVPGGNPITGLAEISFRSTDEIAKLKISPSVGEIMKDEQNVFAKSYMYATAPGNTVTVVDRTKTNATQGRPEGYSVFVFVRKSNMASIEQFRNFLKNEFAGTLSKSSDVLKVRFQLYEKYDAGAWPTPNVDHARTTDQAYSAYLELSFTSAKGAQHFINSASFKALANGISANISALNTYPTDETHTMVIDGVPTTAGLRGVSAERTMSLLHQPENQRTYPVLRILFGDAVKEPAN
jgi:hypothetical protein